SRTLERADPSTVKDYVGTPGSDLPDRANRPKALRADLDLRGVSAEVAAALELYAEKGCLYDGGDGVQARIDVHAPLADGSAIEILSGGRFLRWIGPKETALFAARISPIDGKVLAKAFPKAARRWVR